ncbi:MAG TPA: BamA/TamA family outer membrane protein [Chitinophagaceae bacterium]|nr:BamA/TamA family outer membrane protein [Chitinophagaceae bacterium]
MLHGSLRTYLPRLFYFLPVLTGLLVSSCKIATIVKNYPRNKPFVFQTDITVEGKYSRDEKTDLAQRLKNQLDDSMQVRSVSKVLWNEIRKPPVFDSASAQKSVTYMSVLLNKLGYFRDSIRYRVAIDSTRKGQFRTTTTFTVVPGKQVTLDSVVYHIREPNLQRLTDSSLKDSYLKKGGSFSQDTIGAELDRLVDVYRNHGYLRITRDELVCGWDTLDVSVLEPTFDPFEQLAQLEKIRQHRENPTANLEIRLRSTADSSRWTKYYVGNITLYPDLGEDTSGFIRQEKWIQGIRMVYYKNLFKLNFLPDNVYFRRGDVYNERLYLKTVNRFTALGAWRLVNVDQVPRKGTDTVDFNIRLTPALKYLFTANLEGSLNSGNILTATNLFGLGINVGLQNRNFARASNQSNTNIRFGTEFSATPGQQFIQTKQASIGYNILFPRNIPRMSLVPQKFRDNFHTILSTNLANTDRKDLFNLTTINASWGYDFSWRNRRQNSTKSLTIKIPNIEYNFLTRRDSLNRLIANNPSLRYIFNEGMIISLFTNFTLVKEHKNLTDIFRVNFEESGLVTGLIKTGILDSLYRYVKIDADFGRKFRFRRGELVTRVFAGVGFELQSPSDNKSRYLPFFKQYFAGGPSSMRGWGLRRLGPGSTIKYFDEDPLRSGDIQVEANAEYRFYVANIAGVKLNSALFTDIGNVWFRKKNPDYVGGDFEFNKFYKDLAVDVGTGVRLDFNYFLIRLDYALKARNPSPEPSNAAAQDKWFYGWQPKTLLQGVLQLGVNYPFGY